MTNSIKETHFNLINPISNNLEINKQNVFEALEKAYQDKINKNPLLTEKESKRFKKGFIGERLNGYSFILNSIFFFSSLFAFMIFTDYLHESGLISDFLSLCFMFSSWIYMALFGTTFVVNVFQHLEPSVKVKVDIIKFTLEYAQKLPENEKKELIDQLYKYEKGEFCLKFEKLESMHINKKTINNKKINQNLTVQEKINLLEKKYVE